MPNTIDPRVYELYDTYCHTGMARREFLQRAGGLGVVGGLSMATSLLPNYALACQVGFNDERIEARYTTFPSPGGNGATMRGYLVQPKGTGPFPSVLVVHENRGLNPYIEDVARRLAVAGYLALAPDALWPAGGYPGNDDEGKVLQKGLDGAKILVDMENSARFLAAHERSNHKLGVVGFCFGGAVCNHLAVALGSTLAASVPFYGRPPQDLGQVKAIRARLSLQYAEQDAGVNGTRDAYEKALKAAGVTFDAHTYPGTQHGFHNDSTPRFDQPAAELAWSRTLSLFAETLKA